MVGRAYTMKEMKQIVDYLVEHRAYSDIRGRKMWMDLAASKILDRTWQSLKETFIKRILPDIQNPYYKLTVEQISSFRQESDIAAKNQNKLEIQTISGNSSSTENQRAKEEATKNEGRNTGEDKYSKIQSTRSSTETLVLENCYETAEDIQKDLESPTHGKQKSLRDFITYSEPLTPMLQEVLHDFESDDEPQLQIVESQDIPHNEETTKKSKSPNIRESQSYTKITDKNLNGEDVIQLAQQSKIKSLKLKKTQKGTWENKEPVDDLNVQEKETNNNNGEPIITDKDKQDAKMNGFEKSVNPDKNISDGTPIDTPLPNNQEELAKKPNQNRISTESSNSEFTETHKKKTDKSRKRSRSQSSADRKKQRKSEQRNPTVTETIEEQVDTTTFDSHPQATDVNKEMHKISAVAHKNSNAKDQDDTNIPPNVVADNKTSNSSEVNSQEAGPSGVCRTENPCLKPVSLFAEQFSQSKYSDSEKEVVSQIENAQDQEKIKKITENKDNQTSCNQMMQVQNNRTHEMKKTAVNNARIDTEIPTTSKNHLLDDVVLLKSHSESNSDTEEQSKKKNSANRRMKKARENSLANLFGFACGGVTVKKGYNQSKATSRRYSHRKRLSSRNFINVESGSSDDYTTTDSGSDDHHGGSNRNNEHRRKYVKPQSYDMLSHEGGLFVVGRKKIYPLLLKENVAVHYACLSEGQDEAQTDSYWKAKYLEERKKLDEERKRADELARLLTKSKEEQEANEPISPILPFNQSVRKTVPHNPPTETKEIVVQEMKPDERVRIKFTKNKEIEVEGQWPNINPLLEKMVSIFKHNDEEDAKAKKESESKAIEDSVENLQEIAKKETDQGNENISEEKKSSLKEVTENAVVIISLEKNKSECTPEVEQAISSRVATPNVVASADSEVLKKVDKLESEIFEKIAEIEKSDPNIDENDVKTQTSDVNITIRKRGRPKKSTSSTSRASLENTSEKSLAKRLKASTSQKKRSMSVPCEKRNSRSSTVERKSTKSSPVKEKIPEKRIIKAPKKYQSDTNISDEPNLQSTRSRQSSYQDVLDEDDHVRYKFPPKPAKTAVKATRRYFTTQPRITSPDNSRISENTQGYRDSDPSPLNITKRKKKMTTLSLLNKRGFIKSVKRKSCPYFADDDSTSEAITQKSDMAHSTGSSTLNSDIYRSESYQIMMPKTKNCSHMDKIDEIYSQTEVECSNNNLDNITPLIINVNNEFCTPSDALSSISGLRSSEGNASNISMPLSPEISVVENLSVSKDLISSSLENNPTMNEILSLDVQQPPESKYLMSEVDVTMPLMGQECELQSRYKNKPSSRRSLSECVNEQITSESLNLKLQELLLDSAKKISQAHSASPDKENEMEIDMAVNSEKKTILKKRRSSTPLKKASIPKSIASEIGPVLEEHTEACCYNGKGSGPPVITESMINEAEVSTNYNVTKEITTNKTRKGIQKKNLIKVKITKPKIKKGSKNKTRTSRLSVCTDSGINDTESVLSEDCRCCDVTTELIHNHSDTCLHVDECVDLCDSSVEFVENLDKSVISLTSSPVLSQILSEKSKSSKESTEEFVTPDMFCTDARDATSLSGSVKKEVQEKNVDDAETVYHTPKSGESFNSLITEDLSSDAPSGNTKWYLIDEQATNFDSALFQQSNSCNVGSNLNQIFTSCAVPNLSTITEMSKENDTKQITTNYTDADESGISKGLFD